MIIVSGELLAVPADRDEARDLWFVSWDGGDVYNGLEAGERPGALPGTLFVARDPGPVAVDSLGKEVDRVRVLAVPRRADTSEQHGPRPAAEYAWMGYVRRNAHWEESPVQVIPVKGELFSRLGGLLETDVLADRGVLIAGSGGGAAPIAVELAKSGVARFFLMDHDRLEVGNVSRHIVGLSQVGRYKTNALADAIHEVNPYADVRTCEAKVGWDTADVVQREVRQADLVICGIDEQNGRLVLNKICVEQNKPLLIAGAFRRAYGGQVLRVRPRVSLCYQCFLMMLPEKAHDQEVATAEQAQRLAYSDRPVAIEPGLSTDIAPLSQMVVKLAIQELLRGRPTMLGSLDADLAAPWYIWFNRREPKTDAEKLKPLGFEIDGMHVLRWYGIAIPRRPDCPCCGDFIGETAKSAGIEVTAADLAEFEAQEEAPG